MGREKAALEVAGEALWRRQLASLWAVGTREVLVSGRADGPWAGAGIAIVEDQWEDAGPLGGIVSAGRFARTDWLLVLAVDLPLMTPAFLAQMGRDALESGSGIVPWDGERFHPLAAVYPRDVLEIAQRRVASRELAMQAFVRELEGEGMVKRRGLSAEEARLFANMNTLEQLESIRPLL